MYRKKTRGKENKIAPVGDEERRAGREKRIDPIPNTRLHPVAHNNAMNPP